MTTVHPTRTLYDAIRTQIVTETGEPCGEGVRPPGATPPYSVLYPLPDRASDGSLPDPNQIRWMLFQVTCVGATMDEAQELAHNAQEALLGFVPTGATAIELNQASGVSRDDDGPVFFTTDRYLVYIS